MANTIRTESGRTVVSDSTKEDEPTIESGGMNPMDQVLRDCLKRSWNYNKELEKNMELLLNETSGPKVATSGEVWVADVHDLEEQLSSTEVKLEEARQNVNEIKEQLSLPSSAPHQIVLDRIQEYREGEKIAVEKLGVLQEKYMSARIRYMEAETNLCGLYETKQHNEDKRRQTLQRKLGQMKLPVANLDDLTTAQSTDRRNPRWLQRAGTLPRDESNRYCVLCRKVLPHTEFAAEANCFIHHAVLKDGTWECCQKPEDTAGCLWVPHVKMDITKDTVKVTGATRNMLLRPLPKAH